MFVKAYEEGRLSKKYTTACLHFDYDYRIIQSHFSKGEFYQVDNYLRDKEAHQNKFDHLVSKARNG